MTKTNDVRVSQVIPVNKLWGFHSSRSVLFQVQGHDRRLLPPSLGTFLFPFHSEKFIVANNLMMAVSLHGEREKNVF